jgi:hypothetical protein
VAWLSPEPDVLVLEPVCAARWDDARMSELTTERACRTTQQEKLKPAPARERVLWRFWGCRTLDNAALEQRITLDKQRGVSLTRDQQEAEWKRPAGGYA